MIGWLVHFISLVLGYRRASIYWPAGLSLAMSGAHLLLNWSDWSLIGLNVPQFVLLHFGFTLAVNYLAYGFGWWLVVARENSEAS